VIASFSTSAEGWRLLVVIFSVLLVALFGAGQLLCRWLLREEDRRAFTGLAAGLSLLHFIALLRVPLVLVLALLFVMTGVEGVLRLRSPRRARASVEGAWWTAAIFATALPLWGLTMSEPIQAYDARVVWFFGGRIIFSEGHLSIEAFRQLMSHWGPDYRLFMNPDYPKLVGVLAASVATMAGYWNDYLPKLAILVLHSLSLVGLVAAGWRVRAIALNLVLTLQPQHRHLVESAMLDVHVALLALVSISALARAAEVDDARGGAIGVAVAALAVASQLKAEGRALALIVLVAALVTGAVARRELVRSARLLLLFAPMALWLAEVRVFHVPGYLQYSGGIPVALSRLRTDLWSSIVPGIVGQTHTVVGLASLALAIAAARVLAPTETIRAWARWPVLGVGVLTALGYAGVLVGVYLITPYARPSEQMEVSVGRATLPIEAVLVATALAALERAWRHRRQPSTVALL
jgi:hypothetical protein